MKVMKVLRLSNEQFGDITDENGNLSDVVHVYAKDPDLCEHLVVLWENDDPAPGPTLKSEREVDFLQELANETDRLQNRVWEAETLILNAIHIAKGQLNAAQVEDWLTKARKFLGW